jgi:hypothetical protein
MCLMQLLRRLSVLALFILVSACGGGGGGGSTDTSGTGGGGGATTYTVGGSVSGLTGTVVVQNNGGDNLSRSANGNFTFSTALADGAAYNVTVLTHPAGQTCTVGNGGGTVSGADVTGVTVTCSTGGGSGYQMGGAIQGIPLSLSATVTTLAGTALSSGSADGTGAAARFNGPRGITTDGTNLYVTDTDNHTIRKIVIATGVVTTLAGTAGQFGSADGTGADARFNGPYGITTDGTYLYVADVGNSIIRKIVIATGAVTTLAGTAGANGSTDGVGAAARFNYAGAITTDNTNLYVGDTSNHTIRKIVIATGEVTTLAGSAGNAGNVDGTGAAAQFNFPTGITTDGTNLFLTDGLSTVLGGTVGVRKVVIATAEVTTRATGLLTLPNVGTTDGTTLYVSNTSAHSVRRLPIASGPWTVLAGQESVSGSADGVGSAAQFYRPRQLTTDGTSVFVTDHSNHTIRRIQ